MKEHVGSMTEAYSNPPVVEIICLFRFPLSEEKKWKNTNPGELLKKLANEYPNFETSQDIGVSIHVKEGSISPEISTPKQKQRFIYSSEDKNLSITVAPDMFAFTYKGSYESWKKSFDPPLQGAWKIVSECLEIEHIKSIGVRYINHIGSAYGLKSHEALKSDGEYLPKALVSDHLAFFNRSEIAIDKKNSIIIQVGTVYKEGNANEKIVILDIDRIREDNIKVSEGNLTSILNELQQEIEDVFFSSISDELKQKMV